MSGLFDIASSGIQAYREALAVTGQNIANINTEGYRRRGVDMSEISASQNDVTTIADQTGLGVRVAGISRAFDSFISGRARDAGSDFSQAEAFKASLDSLESALVPGDYDIGYFLNGFFDGLNGVAQAPADLAARTVALTQGNALAKGFVQLSQDLDALRETIWQQASNVARDLNGLLVALRNTQNQLIASGSADGASNAILDARDQTLSEISALVGVSVAAKQSGAVTVTLGRSGTGPVLGTPTVAGSLQLRRAEDRLVFLAGQAPGLTETQQVSSGRLAGLSEAYRSVTQAMGALDALAARLANEFNNAHSKGIDLEGKVGNALFSTDGVFINQSATNLGHFTASATAPDVLAQIAGETRFSYSAKESAWISFDGDGRSTTHPPGIIDIGAVQINVTGTPADGDEFTLTAEVGAAAQMRFLIDRPQAIAAAGLLTSEADITNSGRTTIDTAAIAPSAFTGLSDLTQLLRNDLSTLSATTLRKNGVLGVIPPNVSTLELASMGRQDTVRFALTSAQTKNVATLSLMLKTATQPNGAFFDFDLRPFQTFINDQSGADAQDLARLLNSGSLTTENGTRMADLGFFAAGSAGNLTLAAASRTGAILSGSLSGAGTNIEGNVSNGLSEASNLQIFTRDGRQIAGTPLNQTEVVNYLTEANGFLPEVEYRADLLNGNGGIGYRGLEVVRRTTTGAEVLRFSAVGTASNLQLGAAALMPQNSGGTLSLAIDGEIEAISIPAQYSAALIAERINTTTADSGVRADAATRLSLSDFHDGTVQFTLVAKNETPVEISANITNGSLGNLINAINVQSQDTGVIASLGVGGGQLVLISDRGDDIVLSDIASSGGTFRATAVTDTAAPVGNSATLAGNSGVTTLRLGGDITLLGSSPFALSWQGQNTQSMADPFADGLISRNLDPAGRWQDIVFHLTEGLDTAEADPTGLAATAAATRLSLILAGLNGTPDLSGEINSAELNDIRSERVAEAMAAELRSQGMVPALSGLPIGDNRPADGTTVQILLGEESYGLTMTAGDVLVSGPEAGRITAFFDNNNTLRVAATGGTLSGQILRLSPDTPAADAAIFGLGVAGATATLSGRPVSMPSSPDVFRLTATINQIDTELEFEWDGTFPTNPTQINHPTITGLRLEIGTDGTGISAQIVMTHESGISDFRLRPSVDAVALGLISANADITLGENGLRITATGNTPPALTAQATSFVEERLSLRGLPGEELIVIATGSGARRIAASFDQVQESTRPVSEFTVHVIDAPARRVEIIDRATGHSLATRTVAEDGTFNAYGVRYVLNGPLATGDRFYVRENRNGTGDARNARALFALGERDVRTGLGGFGAEFATLVTNTGAETRSAIVAENAAEARRDAAMELEAEYSGVNLDDEAARLLEQQQAYQALARVLRTAGELLDTLLNAIS